MNQFNDAINSDQNNDPDINFDVIEFVTSKVPEFKIYEYSIEKETYYLFGVCDIDPNDVIRRLWVPLSQLGYTIKSGYELGEFVLIVSPTVPQRERVWINVVLLIATIFSTMLAGSLFFFNGDPFSHPVEIFKGLPYTLAIMFVLGSHEMGHYIVAKMHGMKTSLPYFIPFPHLIGTMGAVIKHRGPIPSRTTLFDVAVAGPIVGLVASVLVIIIGLSLPPIPVPQDSLFTIQLSLPILFTIIADFVGGYDPEMVIHPVVFAGWVGMLVTTLNLIPAGQLDGGHMMRAILGPRSAYVSAIMPLILLSISMYIFFILHRNGTMWLFWGILIALFASSGHPQPLEDSDSISRGRIILGILTFIAGLMCATLTPIQI